MQDTDQETQARAEARIGDWIETYTGRKFWPMDPRTEEIDIRDIAHALSMQCRYAGHCQRFYSVAEHSYHMARAFRLQGDLFLAKHALLHDGSEAYLPDMPRPIKRFLPDYRKVEMGLEVAISLAFGLLINMPADVKLYDTAILKDEREQNMSDSGHEWATDYPGRLNVTLQFWDQATAEHMFLMEYDLLFNAGG